MQLDVEGNVFNQGVFIAKNAFGGFFYSVVDDQKVMT